MNAEKIVHYIVNWLNHYCDSAGQETALWWGFPAVLIPR